MWLFISLYSTSYLTISSQYNSTAPIMSRSPFSLIFGCKNNRTYSLSWSI
jgi:hypothetical protein